MQVGAAVPQDAPPRTSLDIPLSAGFPDFQGSPAENPVDWENIINLDGEADQQQTQQDGNLQQDQTGQGQDNGKAGAAGKPGEKQRRKRKRDAKQQELNKQAQHRYRYAASPAVYLTGLILQLVVKACKSVSQKTVITMIEKHAGAGCVWSKSVLARQTCAGQLDRDGKSTNKPVTCHTVSINHKPQCVQPNQRPVPCNQQLQSVLFTSGFEWTCTTCSITKSIVVLAQSSALLTTSACDLGVTLSCTMAPSHMAHSIITVFLSGRESSAIRLWV